MQAATPETHADLAVLEQEISDRIDERKQSIFQEFGLSLCEEPASYIVYKAIEAYSRQSRDFATALANADQTFQDALQLIMKGQLSAEGLSACLAQLR